MNVDRYEAHAPLGYRILRGHVSNEDVIGHYSPATILPELSKLTGRDGALLRSLITGRGFRASQRVYISANRAERIELSAQGVTVERYPRVSR